jgi:sulfopyruvate decarboxylase subunit beta
MKRIDVIRAVAEVAGEGIIVSNIGFPSRELYSIADRPNNFYMLGSMGMASSIGLGLSLSQKENVYVIDGDGSILMNLGSLSTIGNYAPPNYHLIIVDNAAYGSTGNQPTHTARGTNLEGIAKGCIPNVEGVVDVMDLKEVLERYEDGPLVVIAKAEPFNADVPIIPLSPVSIKERFRKVSHANHLLGFRWR